MAGESHIRTMRSDGANPSRLNDRIVAEHSNFGWLTLLDYMGSRESEHLLQNTWIRL